MGFDTIEINLVDLTYELNSKGKGTLYLRERIGPPVLSNLVVRREFWPGSGYGKINPKTLLCPGFFLPFSRAVLCEDFLFLVVMNYDQRFNPKKSCWCLNYTMNPFHQKYAMQDKIFICIATFIPSWSPISNLEVYQNLSYCDLIFTYVDLCHCLGN